MAQTQLIKVHLEKSGRRFAIKFPYHREFLDEFKVTIPYQDREWDGNVKAWAFSRPYWRPVKKLLSKYFPNIEILMSDTAEAATIEMMIDDIDDPNLEAYASIGVRSDAPICVIHASWQAIEYNHTEGQNLYAGGDLPDILEARIAYEKVCNHREIQPLEIREEWVRKAMNRKQKR